MYLFRLMQLFRLRMRFLDFSVYLGGPFDATQLCLWSLVLPGGLQLTLFSFDQVYKSSFDTSYCLSTLVA